MTDNPGTGLALPDGASDTFALVPAAWDLADKISQTGFVPSAMRGKPGEIMAAVLTGNELGIEPMTALSKIHVIEGRPSLSAEMLRALVLRDGHEIWFESTSSKAVTICGRRKDSTHDQRVTWTIDDARDAQLFGKANWKKYPRAMLIARATGELCRMMFPDVMAGFSYTYEEAQDGFDFEEAEADPADAPPPDPEGQTRRLSGAKKAPAKKAAAKKAAPAKKAAAKKAAAPRMAAGDRPPLPGEEAPHLAAVPDVEDDDDVVDAVLVGEDGEPVEEAADEGPDAATKARARSVAIAASQAGVDHHDVIYALHGLTSANELTQGQAELTLEEIRRIKIGERIIDTSGAEPELRDAPPAPPASDGLDLADCGEWDGEQWRAYLTDHGIKVVGTLRQAKKIAAEIDAPEPGSLEDLQGTPVAPLLAAWCEEQHG